MTTVMPEFVEKVVGSPHDLQLDGTKIGWYKDRVLAWQRGEKIAPITMDIAWTRKCNAACNFCIFPDTLITMSDGSFRRMEDIEAGMLVASIDAKGIPASSMVKSQWLSSSFSKGLRIKTKRGKVLECTPTHPVMTNRGWISAGELSIGEKVKTISKRADGQIESDARPCGKSKKKGHYGRSVWRELSVGSYEEDKFNREGWSSENNYLERAQSNKRSHEAEQSHEAIGSRCRPFTVRKGSTVAFEEHERELENRQACSTDVFWEGECSRDEQDGKQALLASGEDWREVRRGREILAASDSERDFSQSGLHHWERKDEASNFDAWMALASEPESGRNRVGGLSSQRVERSSHLDKEDLHLDASCNSARDRFLAEFDQISSIEDAGYSAVYDLECLPHHNFIAGGVVVHNCYAQLQSSEGEVITKRNALDFLEDAAEIGVKGVSLISDGESTVVPWFDETIEFGGKLGLQIGMSSNGVRLTQSVLERILPHLTYLRFNFSGGDRKRYAEIMGLQQRDYDRVVQNIKDAMHIKHRNNLPVNINMQMVLMPQDADQIIPLVKLAKQLRPDYLIFKHTADSRDNDLGVDYRQYSPLFTLIQEAEGYSDETFRVTCKWSRIADEGKRDYQRCYGPPFILQMSGNGLIAPCGQLFNERYKKFHIGNICTERFRDMYQSDRYWEVLNYLASDEFNAQRNCGPNCLQTNTNSWLDKFMQGKVDFPTSPAPPHLGFL